MLNHFILALRSLIAVFALILPFSGTVVLQQPPPPSSELDIRDFANLVFLPITLSQNTPGGGGGGGGGPQPPTPAGPTIIDHNSVALFDQIPENYLNIARGYRVLFVDRSVGGNISDGLNCLANSSWANSPASCRRDYINSNWEWKTYSSADYNAGLVPSLIRFTPSQTRYNRSNWTYEFTMGTWSETTGIFINDLAPQYLATKDILSYQFSYLEIGQGSDLANPNTGFFADNPNKYDIYDLERFWQQHPNKTFFLWTTSLSRSLGSVEGRDFNNRMRQYGIDHNMFVFDVAAIESHTETGQPCYDNRDGIPYSSGSASENYPNDGQDLPALCQQYTTEIDGGHLGSVSGGKIRLAKAYWVLMARMAGWDGRTQ